MTRHEAQRRLDDSIKAEQIAFENARYGRTEEREKHYHALQAVISARLALEHSSFHPDPKPEHQEAQWPTK